MSRIESRPSRRGNWDYVFFVDLLGHQEDDGVQTALLALQKRAGMYKVLGSYPQAVLRRRIVKCGDCWIDSEI